MYLYYRLSVPYAKAGIMKKTRLIALILGSIVNLYNIFWILFIGAYYFDELTDGDSHHVILDMPFEANLIFMTLLFCVITIFIAWYYARIGGYLIIISAAMLIFVPAHSAFAMVNILPGALLIIAGILLLFYDYDKRMTAKENLTNNEL